VVFISKDNSPASQYLIDDCLFVIVAATDRRQLRPSDNFKCSILRTSWLSCIRAFAGGPRVWNSLPVHIGLCQPDLTLREFYRSMKTHFFRRDPSA